MAQNRYQKGLPMRKVTVNKKDLLTKLHENRIKHVENYEKAVEEYKAVALVDIALKRKSTVKALDELKSKLEKDPTTKLVVNDTLYFDINPPVSHEKHYDEIIAMFEMEINETVELDSAEFAQYVRDDWDWKGELDGQREFYATKRIGFSQ